MRITHNTGAFSATSVLFSLLFLGAFSTFAQEESQARSRSFEVDESGRVIEGTSRDESLDHLVEERTRALEVLLASPDGRGYLGLQFSELTPELREHFGAPRDAGVLVSRVDQGGPAEKAGVVVGDVLTAIDGKKIDLGVTLKKAVRTRQAGDTVDIEVIRARLPETLLVEIGERQPVAALAFRPMLDGRLRVSPLGSEGVQIDVDEALGQLDTFFGSTEWLETLEGLEGVELEHVEERMRQVEERIRQLEKELREKDEPPE